MNCMEELEEEERVCPKCKESSDNPQMYPFISKGTKIGDRYIIGKGIHKNSESLDYIGYDFIKNSKVYVKEFFPSKFCTRQKDGSMKVNETRECLRKFKILFEDFRKYFRAVARHRNLSNLAAIYDILDQNNTIYVIFEWIDGLTLDRYLTTKDGILEWSEAKILFMPLLSSLVRFENSGLRHLGISPSSMIVTNDGKLKLTNFSTKHLRITGSVLEPELFEGCSALEQYIPGADVSESTDVYSFVASLFFVLTGEYPLSATERKKKDKLLMPSKILKSLPENVISAIANGLKIYPNNRIISFENLRIEISNSPVLQVKNIYGPSEKFECNTPKPIASNDNGCSKWGVISCITALMLLLICFGVYWYWIKDKNSSNNEVNQKTDVSSIMESIVPEETAEKKVEVPQLVGKNVNDAEKYANSENPYTIVVLSEEFHDSIQEGCIISQTPSYGEQMYSGSVIAVNISKGPEKRALPNIAGKSLSEASLILTDAGFNPKKINQASKEYDEGIVIGYQNHQAGDNVDYGSEVVIIVSKG